MIQNVFHYLLVVVGKGYLYIRRPSLPRIACIALYCPVLPRIASYCPVLPRIAPYCPYNALLIAPVVALSADISL